MRAALLALSLLCGTTWADPAAWHVTSDDGGELWLLGSVHYLRQQDYPLPANIDRLYEQADTLVMELDLDDLNPLAVQGAFSSAAMLEPGESLESVLTPSVYALAQMRASELGLDLTLLAPFEPWLIAITLMDLGMNALGFSATQGLEQHLLRRALTDGKEILGLEALEDQIRVFDGLSRSEQEALLVQTLNELEDAEGTMDELLDAWRNGRLDTLADELTTDFESFPGLYQTLVIDRNRNWVSVLTELLQNDSSYLVVVGALHLVGDDNVIELLEARGINVSAMN